MNSRWLVTLIALMATILFPPVAFAQDEAFHNDLKQTYERLPPEKSSGNYLAKLDSAISEIRKFADSASENGPIRKLRDAGFKTAVALKPVAMQLGAALITLYFAYASIQFMAGRIPSITHVVSDVAIPAAIAMALLNYWVNSENWNDIHKFFNIFMGVGSEAGSTSPIEALFEMYGKVMSNAVASIKSIFVDQGGIIVAFKGWGSIMVAVAELLIAAVFIMAIILIIANGATQVLGLILLGPFLTAVGIAFGPLFIIALATPWTVQYFRTWVGFLLSSAALTGVLNVILSLASAVVGAVKLDTMAGVNPSAVGLLATAMVLLTVNAMIARAPEITSALFPGHLGGKSATGEMSASMKNGANTAKSSAKIISAAKKKFAGAGKGSSGGSAGAANPSPLP